MQARAHNTYIQTCTHENKSKKKKNAIEYGKLENNPFRLRIR